MISFREYLDRDRLKKHVKHHNTTKALEDAFPGEELDKAKSAIYTKWRGKGKKSKEKQRHSLRKFIADDDKKWAKLWGAVRADCDHAHEEK
jgi:hypothetical protein